MMDVTIQLEENEKKALDVALNKIGLSISSFYEIYTRKFLKEPKMTLEISLDDPFYSKSNQDALKLADEQIAQGKVIVKTMEELEAMENE